MADAAIAPGRAGADGETLTVQLVRRAQGGDAEAFDRLARARIDEAFRLACTIVGAESDARDAVQEAFVSAWRTLPALRSPDRFDAWLERILVNACRMALRHRRSARVREIAAEDVDLELARSVESVSVTFPDAELVRAALRRLDSDVRVLLVLHHVEDRPVEEIARIVGAPVGTVKWRLHEGRRALERALEAESR